MNIRTLLLLLFATVIACATSQKAQAQCEYRLEMYDSFGDGWNGGVLTVASGGQLHIFTLTDNFDDGSDSTVIFTVTAGEPLVVTWLPGFFNTEVSFEIFNYNDELILDASTPATGVLYNEIGQCPSCIKPADFKIENVWDNRAKLRWTPVGTTVPQGWFVIYGPPGFTPGPGNGDTLYVTQPKATLTGLDEMTAYDVWLAQDCGGNDVSALAGPISFKTYWSDDVGVAGVQMPQSGCDLGNEKVVIIMKNSGANPQSLIPFYYSVNGVSAPIPFPEDGFYTGVLGKDSCELVAFETMYDFSAPGEYVLTAWTEMMGDDDTANDTFVYRFTNRLQVPYFQNFEDWNGGWSVDDSASVASTWAFGEPQNALINKAASGKNAWVTNLTGDYNDEELSYLESPCFDFSSVASDPAIEFSLIRKIEPGYDGLWLEMSTDGGQTWGKVGAQDEGLNWYNEENTETGLGFVWSDSTADWVTAHHLLGGSAGESAVKLRFVFASDENFNFEGAGVDDVRIFAPPTRDFAAVQATATGNDFECGLQDDEVVFTFANIGSGTQGQFSIAYSINGATPVVQQITGVTLDPDENAQLTFSVPFDSRDGLFTIRCWVSLNSDANVANDTAVFTVDHRPLPVPLFEDFEDQEVPTGWIIDPSGQITESHNNDSYVLAFNLYENFSEDFTHDLPRYGMIMAGDTLSFDYRITDYSGEGTVATVLDPDSKIDLQISTDCGQTYESLYLIDENSHTPAVGLQNVVIDLSPFAGQAIRLRFAGTWGSGDFWVDLDNINIRACPVSMNLTATVTPAAAGQTNGRAKVNVGLGNPPYKYVWSTGATTQTALNLAIGTYTVTVTDSRGCSDVLEVYVGNSAAKDITGLTRLSLQPNPTTGAANLQIEFERPADLKVQVLNLVGQVVWESAAENVATLAQPLDLTGEADGIYLLRLRVGDGVRTVKIVKNQR